MRVLPRRELSRLSISRDSCPTINLLLTWSGQSLELQEDELISAVSETGSGNSSEAVVPQRLHFLQGDLTRRCFCRIVLG